jgi:hypothetical protein
VSGSPSLKVTPSWRVKVHVRPSSELFHSSANPVGAGVRSSIE